MYRSFIYTPKSGSKIQSHSPQISGIVATMGNGSHVCYSTSPTISISSSDRKFRDGSRKFFEQFVGVFGGWFVDDKGDLSLGGFCWERGLFALRAIPRKKTIAADHSFDAVTYGRGILDGDGNVYPIANEPSCGLHYSMASRNLIVWETGEEGEICGVDCVEDVSQVETWVQNTEKVPPLVGRAARDLLFRRGVRKTKSGLRKTKKQLEEEGTNQDPEGQWTGEEASRFVSVFMSAFMVEPLFLPETNLVSAVLLLKAAKYHPFQGWCEDGIRGGAGEIRGYNCNESQITVEEALELAMSDSAENCYRYGELSAFSAWCKEKMLYTKEWASCWDRLNVYVPEPGRPRIRQGDVAKLRNQN